ncbi:MAG: ribose-phosphate diphosphokinase [Acholeplasmatales bacterium]|nr:ribose-phosphate diphosphokinase [Acholeplasmatales bacterium]
MTKVLVLENTILGNNILKSLKKEDIVPYELLKFSDGELCVELKAPVRGDDVIMVSSIAEPVNENLVKVLIATDTLKRASAKSITLISPYLGYSRQDRRAKPWQPVSARLVADVLETAGINRIITCDLHAAQIEGFYSIPIDNLPILQIMGNRWRREFSKGIDVNDLVVVSPDAGGVTRARAFMNEALIPSMAAIIKHREKPNEVASMQLIGDVKGKIAIIIDDLVDTGGTLLKASSELKKLGAKKVYVFTTHGVLSGNAIEKISNSNDLDKLFITDTIDKTKEIINDKIEYIDISDILIGVINTFRNNGYISNLIKSFLQD